MGIDHVMLLEKNIAVLTFLVILYISYMKKVYFWIALGCRPRNDHGPFSTIVFAITPSHEVLRRSGDPDIFKYCYYEQSFKGMS